MRVEINPKAVQRQLRESGKFSLYMDNANLKKLKNFFLKCQIKVSDKLAIPISHAKMIAKILIDAKKGAKFGFKTKVHKQNCNFLLVH